MACKEKADNLSLFGFCQNFPDGSVYIEAEGEEKKLRELLAWCRIGESAAEVEKVDCEENKKLRGFTRFEIKI